MQSIKSKEICSSPKIITFKKLLDTQTCKEIIKEFSPKNVPSYVTDGYKVSKSKLRSSSSSLIEEEGEKIYQLRKKTCSLLNWNFKDSERFQFITYKKNEKYAPHFDAFDLNQIKKISKRRKTQRIFTNIIYLNEDFEGGDTHFPKLGISIKAEAGMMLSFENCIDKTNFINPFSIHESIPITKGKKNILISWLLKEVADY